MTTGNFVGKRINDWTQFDLRYKIWLFQEAKGPSSVHEEGRYGHKTSAEAIFQDN